MARAGVLLMAHGTPSSMDEMPEYLKLVRGGRLPSPELIAEMRDNYNAIGGRSPLTEITLDQAAALRSRLGPDIPVAVGMRNWKPFIVDAIAGLETAGVTRIVAVPMAPQFSSLSVAKYVDAAQSALSASTTLDSVRSFHDHPLLVEAFAERIREARPDAGERVIFTAHSLPERVIQAGDPYAEEVRATASAVARRAGVTTYEIAYQSAGRTPEPWIGPELGRLVVEEIARGSTRFLVVPIGFVCDHTEILFDIDIQAKDMAASSGASIRRTESLNTSPTFIRLLDDLVRARL